MRIRKRMTFRVFNNVFAYFGSHHDRDHSMDWNEYCRLFVHRQSDYAVDPKYRIYTHIFHNSTNIIFHTMSRSKSVIFFE